MKVLVVLAHPRKDSFNHAIAREAVSALRLNGYEVVFHDLYEERFDPVLGPEEIPRDATLGPLIHKHCLEIAAADGIVIVHPNWWGQPPAILKGWVDRVIRPGVAYAFREGDGGEGVPLGLLRVKCLLVFNTSNTFPEREAAVFGDPLETIWKNCIGRLCGIEDFARRAYSVVVTSTEEQRNGWLEDVRKVVAAHFPPD